MTSLFLQNFIYNTTRFSGGTKAIALAVALSSDCQHAPSGECRVPVAQEQRKALRGGSATVLPQLFNDLPDRHFLVTPLPDQRGVRRKLAVVRPVVITSVRAAELLQVLVIDLRRTCVPKLRFLVFQQTVGARPTGSEADAGGVDRGKTEHLPTPGLQSSLHFL